MAPDDRALVYEGAAGRVAVFGEIANGATATLHVGRLTGARGLTRTVAVKRLRPELAGDADFVSTFIDETQLAARVSHANVLPTLDVIHDGEDLLVVMEYVAGESLARLMRLTVAAGARMPAPVASAVVIGMLQGLHAAHEAKNEFGEPLGIVHREVSFQNVLVGVDGVARVIGFGIARGIARLAHPDAALGRPLSYLAPEQIRGTPVGRRADVFAAAIVLWEALTHEPLFEGVDDATTRKNVLTMPVPPPSSRVPSLPAAVDAVVLRGLERDPARRWGTAADMAVAVEQALASAHPSEVGFWVKETAEATLAARAQRVAEVESRPTSLRPPPEPSPARVSVRPGRAADIIAPSEFIADALWSDLPREHARPKSTRPPPPSRPESEPVLELDLPLPPPPAAPERRRFRLPMRLVRLGATVLVVLLAALGVLSLVLPGYVRERAIEALAARGIRATVEGVSVAPGSIRLHGVALTSADLPGVNFTAAEVLVEMAMLDPRVATVRGAEVTIDGTWGEVLAGAGRFRAAHLAAAPRAEDAGSVKVVVPLVRVSWTRIAGEGSRLDIPDGRLDVTPRASARLGDELHAMTQKATLTTSAGALGPWRFDLDRDLNGSRLRLAFDPPVPDGPNLLVVWGAGGETNVDANIPRSPLLRLGLPPAIGALVPAAPQQIEAQVHYVRMPGRVEASATVTLVDAKIAQAPGPMDVTVSGSAAGDPQRPIELKDGTLAAGPFKAVLTGPVSFEDPGAVRASLVWKAAPVACEKLAPASVKQATSAMAKQLGQLGNLADVKQQLGDLGVDLGDLDLGAAPHVSGTLTASGTLVLDTADPSKCAFTVKAKNTCGLSLPGGMGASLNQLGGLGGL